jgi:hypothetical protein
LQLKLGAGENQFVYNSSVNLQTDLVTLTTRMEDDFRKIAYSRTGKYSPGSKAVLYADTSRFCFMGDVNNDGTNDALQYSLGNTYVPGNNRIKTVVRKYWSGGDTTQTATTTDSMRLGATRLRFNYKTQNTDSSILSTPVNLTQKAVGVIDLSISLESESRIADTSHSFVQDTALYKVYWRQFRVVGKNLLYR